MWGLEFGEFGDWETMQESYVKIYVKIYVKTYVKTASEENRNRSIDFDCGTIQSNEGYTAYCLLLPLKNNTAIFRQ